MFRFALISLVAARLCAVDPVLDSCADLTTWTFHPGSEFPGATGALAPATGGLALSWNFTGGGHYVSAQCNARVPADCTAVAFTVDAAQPCRVQVRMQDANKRTFQGPSVTLSAGRGRVMQPCVGPWQSSWGGLPRTGTDPGQPVSFTLLVDHHNPTPATGTLTILRVDALPVPK